MPSTLPLVAATAPAQDPPLVDLDNTVFLQLGVFLITAFVLTRFLFKPFLAMRAAREEGIEGARDEAKRMEEQARAQMTDYEQRFARARLKAAEERSKLRGEAVAREREIVDRARGAAQAAIEQARGRIEADARAARAALEPRAQEIARVIAKKVLGREVA